MAFGYLLNIAINISASVIILLLLVAGLMSGDLKQPVFRSLFAMMACVLAGMLFEWLVFGLMGQGSALAGIVLRVADFMSYVAYAMATAMFILYLYRYLSGKTKVSKTPFYLAAAFDAASLLLAVVAAFTHLYARFDENNRYIEQDSFWISAIAPVLVMITCFAIVLRYRRGLSLREKVCLLLYPCICAPCIVAEALWDGVWLSSFAAAVTMVLIYTNLQADMREQLHRQDEELAESRIAIMLSQIQPHFLYNTLSAIDKLCHGTPQAHRAILTFSDYLRGNMDALTQNKLVPFEKELEHTRQYLWLEMLRFEERLQVLYDIQASEFLLPALTLQPLVENAVRYGVTKKEQGGTVTIRTEEDAQGYCISVVDDGAGFSPATALQDGRSHTGIDNVRARLSAMCGGRLSVASAPGQGTTAVIHIPK